MSAFVSKKPQKNSQEFKQNEIPPLCPKCNSEMEKRVGKYGYFWGCKKFKTKKCRGTMDISQIPFEFEFIDYEEFAKNNPTKYLLDLIEKNDFPSHVKELKHILDNKEIVKGVIFQDDVRGKISGIIDYLSKNEAYFEIAKLAYWFYSIEGDLEGKFDFWLNRKPANEFRNEGYIKKSLIDYWYQTPLSYCLYYGAEVEIGEWIGECCGYRIDLVGKVIDSNELIFIEVKGFKQKAKSAMPQLVNYIRYYNKLKCEEKVKKSYIIARGYPRGIFDDDLPFKIGLIGYVVEGDKISFIPWKII